MSPDPAAHSLEAGLIRLALLGAEDFRLEFDDPAVVAALAECAAGDGGIDPERLRPYARRGLAALEAAAPHDARLAQLLTVWRPRALRLAGLGGQATADERLRLRLEDRLAALAAAMEDARAAGDDELAQTLHARYIELGTTYAARMAQAWGPAPTDGPLDPAPSC